MSGQLAGFRLSPQQRRLWSLQGGEEMGPYRAECTVLLEGDLDLSALREALALLAARHEILRTAYHRLPAVQEPLQVIQTAQDVRLVESEEPPGIDLAQGPILQASLVRVAPALHRLHLLLPALASDDRGLGHLIGDLARCYESIRAGGEPQEGPVQYADLSEWQNEMLESEETEAAREYWRERGAPEPLLGLPFEADVTGGFTPRVVRRRLGEELAAGCERLAASCGTPPETVFLAVWQVLLWRLTGRAGLVLGACLDGRRFAELEGAVGLLDRVVPIAARLDESLPFQAVLSQASRSLREAWERLEGFAWELWAPGSFLPAAFEAREAAPASLAGGLAFTVEAQRSIFDRFTVKLVCLRTGGGLVAELHHDAARFAASEAERLLERFAALLDSVVAQPGQAVADLDLLGEAERRQLLSGFNATACALAAEPLLHELVLQQAARTPDRIALVFEGETVRYAELARRVAVLAAHLRRHGVGPEVKVAVCLDRSVEMVVGLLGVLAAGGAYVPLDAGYPRERLAFMIEDSRPAVLLTQERWLDVLSGLPEPRPRIVCLDAEALAIDEGSSLPAVPAAVTADNLAYAIYTSGSTGRPKGVMVSHRAISNRLLWMQREFPLAETDAVVQKTPVSFDASIWEIFVPLLAGARLVLARPGGHQDSGYLVRLIQEREATCLQLVPSMLQVFAEEPGLEGCRTLRRLWSGGEALPDALARRLSTRLAVPLVNLYGPTESSIDASCWPCDGASPGPVVPIGRPIANVEIYLLDPRLRPVPIGVPGELYIGGAGLARGYHGRPDLTAERFVPDPFGPRAGDRLFRTGDLARHRPEGVLEFLGRIDQQVKLRGFRIELGEIEQVLGEHPAVGRAVVAARTEAAGGGQLVAYVVAAGVAPQAGELRAFLADRLPDYMVPSAFAFLDELPLTPSGKLDRLRLPDPTVEEERRHVAPRSLTEQLLAGLWSDVLKVDTVGADDNFFELGGNSLVATQLTSRLRKVLQVEVPIRALFEAPTLRGLSARVEAALTGGAAQRPAILPVPRGESLPLSSAQQRLWFLDRLEPGSASYNLPLSVRLQGPLDRSALTATFSEIARRHETLRTTFTEDDGRPVQIVGPARILTLPRVDLTELPEDSREAEVRRLTRWEARRPFDLARGPLLRVLLLQLGEQEHAALLTMHHIVSDGWSMGVMVRELTELYRAFRHGLPSPLPELPVQYADYVYWQRAWLEGEILAGQVAYWTRQLAGIPPLLELPLDRPRPLVRSLRGARSALRFPAGLAEALEALGRREGSTMFMTLLTAFNAWLYRHTGQPDLVVGTPIANRNQAEIEDLIGFFVNTLVLRTDVAGDPSFRELLGRVREVALGASAHQDLQFERLVEVLQPERNLSHTPLFQVMFVYQNAPLAPVATGDLRLIPLDPHSGTSKFDLTLEVFASGQQVGGVVEYSTDLFDDVTVARWIESLLFLVSGAAADPGRRLSELPLLGDVERHQVLHEWNDTRAAYPTGLLLHGLFEAQAERTPEAVAVVFEESSLTYRELDRRSSRLARELRELGCGPESVVAVLMERSLELMVALLGVLKSGAAYLPLDPEYPAERLAWMLGDAAARIVLTQERLLATLPLQAAGALCLEQGWEGGPDPDSEGVGTNPPADENGLAYLIYTSGSTGHPKGVGVAHRGIVNRLLWMQEAYELAATDRVLQKTPVTFDVSLWELFWPLATGSALVLARPGGHRDSAYLVDLVTRAQVSVLHFVPSMLQLFLEEPNLDRCAGLRLVVASGEALAPDLRQRFRERLGNARLENLYGPTEASVDVTSWSCHKEAPRGIVPIGRPIGNLRIHLVDRDLRLVPRGVAGELLIAGVGLGRGYLGRPDLTAERFIPDAWGSAPGERAYRTGDLARFLPGGEVEYLGRIDHQVKVRGFRIELGEIETTLVLHSGVQEAVVIVRRDTPGEARLVAYVIPAGEPAPGWDELRGFLRERLPDYMVPAAFVMLDKLPVTSNGKLDRRALPAPGPHRPDLEEAYARPSSPVEEALAETWAEVLGLERVGVRDNFFALGGDSMRIVQAISRAQRRGIVFSVQQFYQHQTIRELAQIAEAEPPAAVEVPSHNEDEAELALLLAEIDSLSEEEVRARLLKRMPSTGLDVSAHE